MSLYLNGSMEGKLAVAILRDSLYARNLVGMVSFIYKCDITRFDADSG